jgi:hypothetical protein
VVYQWFRNGTVIPGVNAASYTIPVASAADNGAKFSALVAVQGKSATSTEATLTVTADSAPPTVASATGSGTFNSVTLVFSEPVVAPSATTAANYTVSGGVTVSAATLVNATTVQLSTSTQAENTPYTVTVSNVQDNAGNTIAANSTVSFTSFVFTPGKIKYEVWRDIPGTLVTDLTNSPKFALPADEVTYRDSFESPVDWADNYGARLSGLVIPPTTGSYVFFVNADDLAELYLSTDANPANKKRIAVETGWSGSRNWTGVGAGDVAAKRSDQYADTQWAGGNTINLTANTRYYLELIYKEGGGGDEGEATWKLAADADPAVGSPSALRGDVVGAFAPPTTSGGPEFTSVARQGNNLVIAWSTGTLESADSVTGPWTAVANASSPATIPIAAGNKFYRLR